MCLSPVLVQDKLNDYPTVALESVTQSRPGAMYVRSVKTADIHFLHRVTSAHAKIEELYTRSGIVTQIVSNSELMGDNELPYTQ